MQPSPKSLILDLLATLRRGTMPVGALLDAGRAFGLRAGSLRVALARLLAEGRVERDERGRYRLGAAAAPVASRASGWRELEARLRPWSGAWVGVQLPGTWGGRAARRRGERALRLLGFRALSASLQLRPDNLRGGVAALRAELRALGLPASALVFRLEALDAESEARARELFDGAALARAWRAMRQELEASAARLPGLDADAARVESFLVGGRGIRMLTHDPLLPDALAPSAERRALLAAMRDYDRAGRACWRAFMRAHGVLPASRAPADTRIGAEATALVAPA